MRAHIVGQVAIGLAGLLWIVGTTHLAQAYPSRGGNCAYCHTEEEGVLEISGDYLTEMVEGMEMKTFTATPGGSTQFTLTAEEKGIGRYGIILNRLDLLNEEVQYTPQLYIPDADWSSSRNDHEYLYWYGRYYSTGLTEELLSYDFDLILDPAVKPGFYTLEAQLAGGYPSGDLGWTTVQRFGLRVVPEPVTLMLLVTGLAALGMARRQFRRT